MSNSNIIIRTQYQQCKNLKKSISKTISYITDKRKADSSSIDEYDLLRDYTLFTNNDSYLFEDKEAFAWSIDGDIDAKKDLKEIKNLDESGTLWSLIISFQPDFALNNGLVTKLDYYNLTKKIIPLFLVNVGFKLDNVTWYCTLHRNTDHPHLHINFFEHNKKISNYKIPYSSIHNLKSNIANYLIDNEKFYKLRDQEFNSITGKISLKELTKIKNQKLFGDKYRSDLNKMLLNLYNKLPEKGRLQYNSKNMVEYRHELDNIIEYILLHDSVKYEYARYLRLLDEHQKELTDIYGDSTSNKNKEYYNKQLNKLYSKIGNEILSNYKIYKSMDYMEKEKEFIKKHIDEFIFRSKPYKNDKTKIEVAKGLYKLCQMGGLNYQQTRIIFSKWLSNSKYNFKVDDLLNSVASHNTDLSISEYYSIMKKLGYDSKRLDKFKSKRFYQELNYKRFINQAINYLNYELEQEEKQLINDLEYDINGYDIFKEL